MSDENHIRPRVNGPLRCTGDVEVYDADGNLLRSGSEVELCRCGQSKNKPFCDGSHTEAEFESDGIFSGVTSEELGESGPLRLIVHDNAGLLARGPMTIFSSDGNFSVTRTDVALCRCGQSANKPFCDITHKECQFEG
ncbi:MAG: CDGSH iron-sulfur domain-containing protein [Thiogranum sp.]|nr:CDGSH iron-sulfur domain-containing protein [Thiogranum sp.]